MVNLEELLNRRAGTNRRIAELQQEKRDIENAIFEKVIDERLFDCVKVDYAKIFRMMNPRTMVPAEFK